jgi:hypothetical protein
MDEWGIQPGDVGDLTCPLLPDLSSGSAGLTAIRVVCTEAQIEMRGGAGMVVTLVSMGGGLVPQYGPSAEISTAVYSAGSTTLTVAANTFGITNPQDGLPSKDVSAFTVGDEVDIIDETDGSSASGGNYQTITSITAGSNTIVVDGNFGGVSDANMAVCVLVPAPFASATTTQKAKVAYLSDAGDNTINGTQTTFVFGDM